MTNQKGKTIFMPFLSFFGAAVSLCLFSLGLLAHSANLVLLGVLVLIAVCAVNCLLDLERTIALALYLVSFFTFMLGQVVINLLRAPAENDGYYDALVLIYVAMAGISIGMAAYQKWFGSRTGETVVPSRLTDNTPAVQKISLLVFLATMVFRWMVIIEEILVVRQFGYIGLYTQYNTVIPWVVHKLAVFCETAFFIYLVTFPPKRQTYVVMGLFLFGKVLELMTGVRGGFLTSLLLLVMYVFVRNGKMKDDRLFSGKFFRIAFIFGGVALVAFMGVYSSVRQGESAGGLLSGIATFFSQQGGSIGVVQGAVEHRQELHEMNRNYSAFSLLICNPITRTVASILFGDGWGRSELYTSNLCYSYAYIIDPAYEQAGGTFGTAYIAELYLDYSYLGVFLFNICLGFLLMLLCRFEPRHWIWNMYCMYSIRAIFFLPRDCTVCFVTPVLSVSSLLLVLVIVYISNLAPDQMIVERRLGRTT